MKRREFLKSAMATGAGLLLFPDGLRGQAAPGNKLNIALIGCGAQGQVLLESLLVIEGIKLVVDAEQETQAREILAGVEAPAPA